MWSLEETIKNETLQARYLVLELAALLDRLDEAAAREGKSAGNDPRVQHLMRAVGVLPAPASQADRTERILRHYSDPEK